MKTHLPGIIQIIGFCMELQEVVVNWWFLPLDWILILNQKKIKFFI